MRSPPTIILSGAHRDQTQTTFQIHADDHPLIRILGRCFYVLFISISLQLQIQEVFREPTQINPNLITGDHYQSRALALQRGSARLRKMK